MHVGYLYVTVSRKEHQCVACKEFIEPGQLKLMIVRGSYTREDGRKGRRYRYVHLEGGCFASWVRKLLEWWEEHSEPKACSEKTGRPLGSKLQSLTEEQITERRHLLQKRHRLHKRMLATEDTEQLMALGSEMRQVETLIRTILPIQVERPGRRTAATRELLTERRRFV
jgi:hypothetical protein